MGVRDLSAAVSADPQSLYLAVKATADAAEPAAHASATYSPLTDNAALFLPAEWFNVVGGTPAIPISSQLQALMFDPTTIEVAACNFRVPASWNTATVTLWAATASTGVGVVRWNPRIYTAGIGETLAPGVSDAGITATVDMTAPNSVNLVSVACGTFTCQPSKMHTMWLQRNASSGSDTYASDAGIAGVVIAKAS